MSIRCARKGWRPQPSAEAPGTRGRSAASWAPPRSGRSSATQPVIPMCSPISRKASSSAWLPVKQCTTPSTPLLCCLQARKGSESQQHRSPQRCCGTVRAGQLRFVRLAAVPRKTSEKRAGADLAEIDALLQAKTVLTRQSKQRPHSARQPPSGPPPLTTRSLHPPLRSPQDLRKAPARVAAVQEQRQLQLLCQPDLLRKPTLLHLWRASGQAQQGQDTQPWHRCWPDLSCKSHSFRAGQAAGPRQEGPVGQ